MSEYFPHALSYDFHMLFVFIFDIFSMLVVIFYLVFHQFVHITQSTQIIKELQKNPNNLNQTSTKNRLLPTKNIQKNLNKRREETEKLLLSKYQKIQLVLGVSSIFRSQIN